MKKCNNKIIVFDLDETIGHFEQVSIFLNGMQNIIKTKITDKYLFKLLDIWPNIFRYKIFEVFKLLKNAKIRNHNIKVVIYTNNMGPRSWTLLIKKYIEKKINFKLFDTIISAYRPREKTNFRTTHEKTFKDLIRSIKGNEESDILFFDDVYHEYMKHHQLKYVKLIPYRYSVESKKMIYDYVTSKKNNIIYGRDIIPFKKIMLKFLNSGPDKYRIYSTPKHINVEQHKIIIKSIRQFLNIKDTGGNKYTRKKNKYTRKKNKYTRRTN